MAQLTLGQASPIRDLGRAFLASAQVAASLSNLPYAALKAFAVERNKGRRLIYRATAYQIYFTAVQPLLLFAFLALLTGLVVVGASDRLLHGAGLGRYVEVVAARAYVRELAPLLLALVLTGRSGPAIATELGYMRVNHEIEGLESLGVNLDYYLVFPRVVGVAVGAVLLGVVMAAVGLIGGWFVGISVGLVTPGVDFPRLLSSVDLATGLLAICKALAFGCIVGTVGCHYGLAVGRTHTEIPRANVRTTVLCYTLCFTFNAAGSLLAVGWGL